MMSLNLMPAPPPSSELALVASLLDLLADPKAYKAKLAELAELTGERNKVLAAANAAITKLQSETAKAEKKIAAERKAAEEQNQQRSTENDVAGAALRQRSEQLDAMAKSLEAREKSLNDRLAVLERKEAAFATHAAAVASI